MKRSLWRRFWSPPLRWQRRFNRGIAILLLVAVCGGGAVLAFNWDVAVTGATLAEARSNQTALRNLLHRMPKGGDLHVHLSGAVYAEDFIALAAAADLCVQLADFKVVPPNAQKECDPATTSPAARALTDQSFYDAIVDAQSMRNFVPSPAVPSGHDQFFATFGKYGEVSWRLPGQMTALLLRRYAAERVQYTELMITLTPQSEDLDKLLAAAVDGVKSVNELPAKLALLKDYIAKALPEARKNLDVWQAATQKELSCGISAAEPGCGVGYRYIAQINRNSDAAKVFVNTAFAAALVRADKRVAGLNFVGPEDYRVARADYREHMKMIGYLTRAPGAPVVPVALHAGELWLGLVPPEDLTFHITDAVETAGAQRIGHGVALAFEPDKARLLADMKRENIAVEINLTSNDVILGVRGKDHPLTAYRAAGVPVVLSTDDAGVSRIDLTNEYLRAARDYGLGYGALKTIARASLTYSFLNEADKRAELAKFDRNSAAFERATAARHSLMANLELLIQAAADW